MIAFHGKPAIKKKYLARVEAHRRADEIVQGLGWDEEAHQGCSVGCTFDSYEHSRFPDELGIPLELGHLNDAIHEGLPLAKAKLWPGRFLAAPRPGADLSLVWARFAHWLLTDEVAPHLNDAVRPAVDGVADLFAAWIALGKRPLESEWAWAAAAAWAAETAATAS